MISNYPESNNELIFENEEELVNHIIDFIKTFRNIRQENNIGSDYKIKLETKLDDLIIKMLKLDSHITEDNLEITKYHVTNNYYSLDIYYEKVLTEEDIKLKEKQIETLKNNILRREKLLNNEGYLNKAPKELVESERQKLEEERNLLEKLCQE